MKIREVFSANVRRQPDSYRVNEETCDSCGEEAIEFISYIVEYTSCEFCNEDGLINFIDMLRINENS